jgi:anti-sigma B factor antagonist
LHYACGGAKVAMQVPTRIRLRHIVKLENLDAAVEAAIADRSPELTVDLGGIAVLDAPLISKLISALRKMHDSGGTVRLAAAGQRVRETLRVTGLDQIFDIVDSSGRAESHEPDAGGRSLPYKKPHDKKLHSGLRLQGTAE